MMDLNFNSTSKRVSAESADFSSAINGLIDKSLQAAHAAEEEREFNVSPSAIGHECARKVQFQITGVPWRPAGKLLRIFERGHIGEDMAAAWLVAAGLHLSRSGADGRQHGFQVAGGNIRGRVDGVVLAGPEALGLTYPCLWECKVLGGKGWMELRKKGLAVAYPQYAAQVALYQAYMDLTEPAIVTAVNANTMELHHELVRFDVDLAQRTSDRAVDVLLATQGGELLPRAGGNPDGMPCRFCDFSEHCWVDGGLGPKRPRKPNEERA